MSMTKEAKQQSLVNEINQLKQMADKEIADAMRIFSESVIRAFMTTI